LFIVLIILRLLNQISFQFVTGHYLQLSMLTLSVNYYTSVISKPFQPALDNPCNELELPFI